MLEAPGKKGEGNGAIKKREIWEDREGSLQTSQGNTVA
jgi:hypothetical protein